VGNPAIVGLGARVHVFVRPEDRTSFTALFRDVLGCGVTERDFGMAHPILFVGSATVAASASSSANSRISRSRSRSTTRRLLMVPGSSFERPTWRVVSSAFARRASQSSSTRAAATSTSAPRRSGLPDPGRGLCRAIARLDWRRTCQEADSWNCSSTRRASRRRGIGPPGGSDVSVRTAVAPTVARWTVKLPLRRRSMRRRSRRTG